MMEFKTPWALLVLPAALAALWYVWRHNKPRAFGFSSMYILGRTQTTWKTKFAFLPQALRVTALILVVIALAGPRKVLEESRVVSEGIDIVLALDCSGSMAAEDFTLDGKRLNRFAVIQNVVSEFIGERKGDQMALVAFSGKAYTVCPLTIDHSWLMENLKRMRLGLIEDGTAIGSGIAASVARFKDSKAKSKIIVLLTDGVNNAGTMDPVTAAKAAAALGIKIYTIGAGSKGPAPYPVTTMFGQTMYQMVQSDLDEPGLRNIAALTHGKYFRATDTDSLREIYKTIDALEKSKIEYKGYRQYQELFWIFLTAALLVVALELLLSRTVLLRIP